MSSLSVLLVALTVTAVVSAMLHDAIEPPSHWKKVPMAVPDHYELELTFELYHRNLRQLEHIVQSISDPSSTRYGRYLTREQLKDLVAPGESDVQAVESILQQNSFTHITRNHFGDFVRARAPAHVVQRFLQCQLALYARVVDGNAENAMVEKTILLRASSSYRVPEELALYVKSVPGLLGFPGMLKINGNLVKTRSEIMREMEIVAAMSAAPIRTGLTPSDVIALYQVAVPSKPVAGSSQAVVEFYNWYSPDDLQTFFKLYAPQLVGEAVGTIYGKNRPDIHVGVEANLDVQYLMGIGQFVDTSVYDEPFTTDILQAFLNYTTFVNGQANPALVHSISFGEYGGDYPNATVQAIDVQFQMMCARGISVLVASGDNGVGCGERCQSQEFDFPASPYITLVGATQLLPSGVEVGATFSSGGFSRDNWQQPWQAAAIDGYFSSGVQLPPASSYFASGRGYPDVSALGVNISIVVKGKTEIVGGTSASAPIFAGIVSILNNYRLSNNKSPLGWLNPMLYQNPKAFTDITSGDNSYQCCKGFKAYKGWDPVTGLGTPVYPALLQVVKSLP